MRPALAVPKRPPARHFTPEGSRVFRSAGDWELRRRQNAKRQERSPILIFLDFDGVLRRRDSPPYRLEKPLLDAFQAAVRRIPGAEIVITSSWCEVVGLSELRKLFSPDIAPQVVGVVPIGRFRDDFPRYGEVLAYLKQQEGGWRPWIAVDDDERAYPGGAPVVVVNPNFGFGAAEAERLVEMAEG